MPYPLITLFNLRERAKKDSENKYAEQKHKQNEAEKKLKELKEELAHMKDQRAQKQDAFYESMSKPESLTRIEFIKISQTHIKMLIEQEILFSKKIDEQKEIVEREKKLTAKALEIMMKATEEFKVLEKHKEKWMKMRKKELEKREEDAADEIVQARFSHVQKEFA